MLKAITLGFVSLLLTAFVAATYVNAQETTTTPSPTETETDTPSGAPQTGFGY